MTLLEILLGTVLFMGSAVAVLFGMHYTLIHGDYMGGAHAAMTAAQGRLEELEAMPFDMLWVDASVQNARSGRQVESLDLNGDGAADGQLAVQIRSFPLGSVSPDPTVNFLDLHVAACWAHRGRQLGEQNGATLCQDAADANWVVDSPVMVGVRVARRD